MKFISTTIVLSVLLVAAGCSPSNQVVQQRQACTAGEHHPWCMQLAQTKPLGAAPYGLESNAPANPEMEEDHQPYPTNPALPLVSVGGSLPNVGGVGGIGAIGGVGGVGGMR
jgi:hypothetical protein